jgi:glycosyltransferase involved in cell wall biosynthesis
VEELQQVNEIKCSVLLVGPKQGLGGVANHIKILEAVLSRYRVEVEVSDNSTPARQVWGRFFQLLSNIYKYRKQVNSGRYDVVHLNASLYPWSFIKLCIYLGAVNHSNIVTQFHGGSIENINLLKFGLLQRLSNTLLKRCKAILFLTNEQQAGFTSVFTDMSSRTKKVTNFLSTETPKLGKRSFVRDTPLVVLFLGRIHRKKGIFKIVDAAASLKDLPVQFWFVGDGEDASLLRAAVKRRGLQDSVLLLGELRGKDKQSVFEKAHIFVLPSENEGVPYALLEAMQQGLVCLCTSVGGMQEVIEDGINGLFVERDGRSIAATIKDLLTKRDYMECLGRNAAEYVDRNHSAAKLVQLFTDIYFE